MQDSAIVFCSECIYFCADMPDDEMGACRIRSAPDLIRGPVREAGWPRRDGKRDYCGEGVRRPYPFIGEEKEDPSPPAEAEPEQGAGLPPPKTWEKTT